MLQDKIIVVGITGGIAAYKAADLVSRLRKAGVKVHVIMTPHACHFVSPLTFQSLSANPVHVEMFGESKFNGIDHIELAQKAHLLVIAPATANIIAKAANGLADDLLSTVLLARKGPVLFVPAMNEQMYLNPVTQANLAKLKGLGYRVMDPGVGFQACGAQGPGRMAEPAEIFTECSSILNDNKLLNGKTVMVTAGGTQEAIDPVRYIGNRSSGKMGYALARVAAEFGARVILISGPVALEPPEGVEFIPVGSAMEMFKAVLDRFPDCDVVIKAAAVADYRPERSAEQKIKKSGDELLLKLVPNPDILGELGKIKGDKLLVGFAAETQSLVKNAAAKLRRKNVDILVANDVTKPGAGFGSDTNLVTLLYRDGEKESLPLLGKLEVAREILDRVCRLLINTKE